MSEDSQDLSLMVQALQHAPCGAVVASTQADGAMLYANDAFTTTTGYRLEDLPTVQAWILAAYPDPDYRAMVLGNWERDVSEPKRDVVYRVRCADGSDKYLSLRAAPLPAGRMVVTMVDVTTQQRATIALKESEERFRQLADTLDLAFWIVQPTPERILFVSPAFEGIWGITRQELYDDPRQWSAAIHPEDQAAVLQAWERCLAGHEQAFLQLYRVVRPDGVVRWVEDGGHALRDADGRVYRMVGTAKDVTDEIRVSQALRESEERFRQLADTMPTGLVVHAQGEIVYANRAAAQVAGCQVPDELLGRGVFSFVHPDSLETTRARIATVYAKAGDAGWTESRFQRADGVPFPVEVASSRIDWKGAPAGLVIFNDISQRKQREDGQRQLERRMLEAQRMESLAVLAGGVAHDFNNLLVGILGNADLALMELPASSAARARLEGIELAARRSADLARQMLAYSGKGRFVVGELDLHNLLREISHLLEATITRKAVVRYAFGENLPLVRGDATQIRQVVMNLMTNAAEAIHETSGIITIATGLRHHRDDDPQPHWPGVQLPPGHYATITISDTGMGMDEATRSRIFDPFFTTKFTGRGLGLAAVLGIVKGHGGSIRVSSEPGRGSSFEVLLPALMHSIELDEEELSDLLADRQDHTRTVFIVDDDETVRVVASAMLAHGGYQAISAADGSAAVELYAQRGDEVDLVLLDLSMPLMDGQECFERLRELDPQVRVVLSSGYNEQDAINRFTGDGLAGFIQKPYRAKGLLAAVGKALDTPHP